VKNAIGHQKLTTMRRLTIDAQRHSKATADL
jgi:hypothetical protein